VCDVQHGKSGCESAKANLDRMEICSPVRLTPTLEAVAAPLNRRDAIGARRSPPPAEPARAIFFARLDGRMEPASAEELIE